MKSKKILIFIVILIYFITNVSFGNHSNENKKTITNEQISGEKKTMISFPEHDKQEDQLSNIKIKYCNDGFNDLTNNLFFRVRPKQEKEICIIFFNGNKENIKVWGKFPDNAIEPNGNRNCSTNYGRDNPFSKFIKPIEDIIEIPAMGNKVIKTTVKFPVGIKTLQRGCFVYGIVGAEKVSGNFIFIRRNISYINISVEGEMYKKIEETRDFIVKQKKEISLIIFIITFIVLLIELKKFYLKK